MKPVSLIFSLILMAMLVQAQHIETVTRGNATSIRGLSVVDDQVIWISGSNGQVGRSIDGGANWQWETVKGYEKRDFRDIEAFDKNKAIIIAIAEPATILKTADGGKTWKTVYENNKPGMFLDAMEFSSSNNGIVLGDPVNGKFFMATTSDQGNTWQEMADEQLPVADSGEACFASSGTNIRFLSNHEYCFITGGTKSHFMSPDTSVLLPIIQGTASTGANSIAASVGEKSRFNQHLVVVGGDFAKDSIKTNNCFLSKDGGKTWFPPVVSPGGYRSCVEFINRQQVISCGTSGVDLSEDGGLHWRLISGQGFHVCRSAKKGSAVFLAGSNGRVGKLVYNNKK